MSEYYNSIYVGNSLNNYTTSNPTVISVEADGWTYYNTIDYSEYFKRDEYVWEIMKLNDNIKIL